MWLALVLVIVFLIVVYFVYQELWKKYTKNKKKELLTDYTVWTKQMIMYKYMPPTTYSYMVRKKYLLDNLRKCDIDLCDYTDRFIRINDAIFRGDTELTKCELQKWLADYPEMRDYTLLTYYEILFFKTKDYKHVNAFDKRLTVILNLVDN